MSFITDEQTLGDLNIFDKKGKQSVYALFNHTKTNGGAAVLKQMFDNPLSDAKVINQRSEMLRYIHSLSQPFPIQAETISIAEQYLENTDSRSRLVAADKPIGQKIRNIIATDIEQDLLIKGITAVTNILNDLNDFLKNLLEATKSSRFKDGIAELHSILAEPVLQSVIAKGNIKKLPFADLAILDQLFRFKNRDMLKMLFYHIYLLDVFITIANVAVAENMAYATTLPKTENLMRLEGVYHPFLKNPVANSVTVSKDHHIIFLTGANMAGKSTFMKSVGIALFLAHMGFPVPAKAMEFSVLDGLLTTINLSDDLSSGYSHFYAEVLRVKKMAEQVKSGKNIFIILDEVFRGTNVKDAYEATVAITSAIAHKPNCLFLVSTHITEAAEELQKYKNIDFVFLPAKINGNQPFYTYQLQKGVSDDRHGMLIIQNEHILEILKQGINKQATE